MTTAFLSRDIWPQLTKAARDSRQRCAVAVAYFGKGASRLLPLGKGSRLVVDASERSVASGQTCPADLIKLVKRGVAVYGVPNLHAKVFVLGRNGLYRFCQCLQPLCFATGRGCHSHHRTRRRPRCPAVCSTALSSRTDTHGPKAFGDAIPPAARSRR